MGMGNLLIDLFSLCLRLSTTSPFQSGPSNYFNALISQRQAFLCPMLYSNDKLISASLA